MPNREKSPYNTEWTLDFNTNNPKIKNSKIAFDYLVKQLEDKHPDKAKAIAAGIVGNLYNENIGNPKGVVNEPNLTKSFGIAGFNSSYHWENLINYCSKNGKDYDTLEGQLDYILDQVKNYKWDPDPQKNSVIFGRDFERFSGFKDEDGPEHSKRKYTALQIYNKW